MRQKTMLLLQLIAEKSATAGGFFTADAKFMQSEKNAAKLCRQQVADGLLFRVRAGQTTYGYFATQALANAHQSQHQDAVLAKAATQITFSKKTDKPQYRADVAIVHTPKTRYISRMMPPMRNQVITHSFIHNGMGAMR